jgi:predicted N-acetyltransferase YhbS
MRNHPDFIRELDLVAVCKDRIIGNIMYTKSSVVDESGNRIDTIAFGPISVLPEHQRQGVGSALIKHSIKIAIKKNYKAILIQGHPNNYCKHGFKSSKDFNISDSEGKFPYSLLVLELEKGIFHGRKWKYYSSNVFALDENAAEDFDKQFEARKKEFTYTQEEFSIACRAYLA